MKYLSKPLAILLSAIFILTAMPLNAMAEERTFNVSTAEELTNAAAIINAATEEGSYIVNLTDDIIVPGFSVNNAKTTTTIIGNGHTLQASDNSSGVVHISNGATVNFGDVNDSTNTLTIVGTQIHNTENDPAINIYSGSTCNIYAGTIIKDSEIDNNFGGGIKVDTQSTLNMYGGTIDNCGINGGSVCYGGGVAVINASVFNMYGGTIKNCYAKSNYTDDSDPNRCFTAMGGGVFVTSGSKFTMNGGSIENCDATNMGGGIALDISYGELTLNNKYNWGQIKSDVTINGGTIRHNTANTGAGLFASGYYYSYAGPIGTFNPEITASQNPGLRINNALITDNVAAPDDYGEGGGICALIIHPYLDVQISNTTISNNAAYKGAGIDITSNYTSAEIENCNITGNAATDVGGGLCITDNSGGYGTYLIGSTITGNTSGAQGAGVYYDEKSKLQIAGANIIENNKWNGIDNNLNIISAAMPVYVIDDLTGSKIGVTDYQLRDDGKTDEDASAVSAGFLTSGYKTYNSVNPNELFTSDHKTWVPEFSEDTNEVRLIRKSEPENSVYLTTKDSVDINFLIDADYYTSDPEAYVKLNYNHNPRTYQNDFKDEDVPLKSVEKTEDGRYKFTIKSAPAQLTEPIAITLYDSEGNKLYDANYSMWQYCKDIMDRYISIEQHTSTDMYDEETEEQFKKASELCKSLIDYATAAQVYFNYNKADMASKLVPQEETYYHDDVTNENYYHDVTSLTKEQIKANGAPRASISGSFPVSNTSLMSLSNTEVRFYYEEDINEDDYELSVSCESWYGSARPSAEFGEANSGKFISVGGIESTNLDNLFTLTINNKNTGEVTTIKYNATAYCYTVLRDTEAPQTQKENELRTLVKTIYLYNRYAEDYFTTVNG